MRDELHEKYEPISDEDTIKYLVEECGVSLEDAREFVDPANAAEVCEAFDRYAHLMPVGHC